MGLKGWRAEVHGGQKEIDKTSGHLPAVKWIKVILLCHIISEAPLNADLLNHLVLRSLNSFRIKVMEDLSSVF